MYIYAAMNSRFTSCRNRITLGPIAGVSFPVARAVDPPYFPVILTVTVEKLPYFLYGSGVRPAGLVVQHKRRTHTGTGNNVHWPIPKKPIESGTKSGERVGKQ